MKTCLLCSILLICAIRFSNAQDGCASTLTTSANQTTLVYPSSGLYPNNVDCSWLIDANDPEMWIAMTINWQNIETSTSCTRDSMRILTMQQNVLFTTCTTTDVTSDVFLIRANKAMVWFKSDASVVGRGFSATFAFLTPEEACQHTLSREGNAVTLAYPSRPSGVYQNNAACSWAIEADEPGQWMEMTINWQSIETITSCTRDSMRVLTMEGNVLFTTCLTTNVTTDVFLIRANKAMVSFKSDASVVGRGFSATFAFLTPEEACQHTLSREGNAMTLAYPARGVYQNNAACSWVIEADEPGQWMALTINWQSIETTTSCTADSMRVLTMEGNALYTTCKTTNATSEVFLIHTNKAMVSFKSDASVVGRGFSATFTFVSPADACQPSLSSNIHETVLAYPPSGLYPNKAACSWDIETVQPEQWIGITINWQDIETTPSCSADSMKVYSTQGSLLFTTCAKSSSKSDVFIVRTNKIRVAFTSDASVVGRGFSATFSFIRDFNQLIPIGL